MVVAGPGHRRCRPAIHEEMAALAAISVSEKVFFDIGCELFNFIWYNSMD